MKTKDLGEPVYLHIDPDGSIKRVEVDDLKFSALTLSTGVKIEVVDGDIVVKEWDCDDGVETWIEVSK